MSENGEVRQEEWPSSPSRQRRHLLQGIFFLLGVGILMPWNAFISAKQYFESRQCGRVVVDKSIESTFAVVYNLAAVLCLGFIIAVQWIQDRQKQQQHHHQHHQHHRHGAVEDILEESPSITAAATAATATAAAATSAAAGMSIIRSNNNSNNSNNNRNNNLSNRGICASDRSSGHAFWIVMVPLAMYVMVFMLQTVLVLWMDIPPDVFRTITLASLIACGMLGSIAQAGIVATAGLFHSSIGINPFLAGQSAGGLAVSLCNFLAAALEDPSNYYKLHCTSSNDTLFETLEQGSTTASVVTWDHLYTSTHRATSNTPQHGGRRDDETCVPYTQKDMAVFSYFLAGSIVLVACLVGYYIIDRFQHGHHRDDYETVIDPAEPIQGTHHHHRHNSDTNDNTLEHQSPRIGLEMNPRNNNNHGNLLQTLSVTGRLKSRIEGSTVEEREEFHDEDHDDNDNHDENGSESSSLDLNETQQVWSIVKKPAACIFLVFFVTLGLFPGWVSQLRSTHECREPYFRIQNDLYTPAAFCLFNAGDFVGRILSAQLSLSRIRNLSNKLVMAAAVRVTFFPLFFLCVGGSRDGRAAAGTTGPVIHSDFYSFMIQSGFSLTNGLLLTTAFAHAPSLLANVTHVQERSSEILNFAVVFGLLIGSLVSVPIVHWFD
jgi:Nucleoside transporter